MPFLTDKDIAQRKAAGVVMKKLNCGWTIDSKTRAQIITKINAFHPETETEQRDKHILELAFIENMNASQIARLNDPLIVGHGNRSRGKPLSPSSILEICYKYAPEAKEHRGMKAKAHIKEKRNELYRHRQQGKIERPKVCSTCGSAADIELHHIIPLAAGGTNDYFNLIYLCHSCHMALHHRIYDALIFSKMDMN